MSKDAITIQTAVSILNGRNAYSGERKKIAAELGKIADAPAASQAREQRLVEILRSMKRGHYSCDDRWYSCPKHEDGCANEFNGPDCDCGADQLNAEIDKALAEYESTRGEQG